MHYIKQLILQKKKKNPTSYKEWMGKINVSFSSKHQNIIKIKTVIITKNS